MRGGEGETTSAPFLRRLSGSSPVAGRCQTGNSQSAAKAPDYGFEQDTDPGYTLLHTADRARGTVAKPQRSARATTARLRPAAPARPPNATAAATARRNTCQPPAAKPTLPLWRKIQRHGVHARMSNGPAIVIDVTRGDWPGGPRTLTPFDPNEEPNRRTTWFGAELAPGGNQMWFRITLEAVHRIQENTPGARGKRLVDALLAWLSDDPDHQLEDLNRFQVYVSDAGDTRIEPYGG